MNLRGVYAMPKEQRKHIAVSWATDKLQHKRPVFHHFTSSALRIPAMSP